MTEDLKGETSEATEDLTTKLQQIQIFEVPPAVVNMVNARRPLSEIEELEKWLMWEKANIEIPPRGNNLKYYLWNCHIKNGGKRVMCPRCSIMTNRRVNLMPQYMLKRIGMFDTDIRPHNMVLSNYEGKIG